MKVTIDGVNYVPEIATQNNTKSTIVDELSKYRGTQEYNGIVSTIQTWFYGKLIKQAWCATCISYFANLCGILEQIGGKNENVYNMLIACRNTHPDRFYSRDNLPATIKKNDILFWLWSGDTMNAGSSKHVGVAEYDSDSDIIYCLGGNQKDKICTLAYNRKYLYAVYRPKY